MREGVGGNAVSLQVRRHRRADRQAAVAHVGEDVDVLHAGEPGEPHVELDVREDAARRGDLLQAGPAEGLGDEGGGASLEHALGHVGELLRGVAPEDLLELPEHRRRGVRRDDVQAVRADHGEQRVFLVRDRVGVVGQGHDLALVLEFAHVHEVCHVLEEDAERGAGGQGPDERQAAVREPPQAAAAPVADTVEGDDQGLGETAAAGRGGGVGKVVIDPRDGGGAQAQRSQPTLQPGAA